jgi:hypothetical protein
MLFLSFNSQEERPPFLGCPQLPVYYSHSYRPFLWGCLLNAQHVNLARSAQSSNVVQYLCHCTFYISQKCWFLKIVPSRNIKHPNGTLILNKNTNIIRISDVFRWIKSIYLTFNPVHTDPTVLWIFQHSPRSATPSTVYADILLCWQLNTVELPEHFFAPSRFSFDSPSRTNICVFFAVSLKADCIATFF